MAPPIVAAPLHGGVPSSSVHGDVADGGGGLAGGGAGGAQPTPPPPSSGVTVQGYVKDAANQSGVAGATVTVGGRSDTTDSSGHYRITNVPTGSRQVSVALPAGYSLAGPVPGQQVGSGTNTLADIFLISNTQGPPAPPPI